MKVKTMETETKSVYNNFLNIIKHELNALDIEGCSYNSFQKKTNFLFKFGFRSTLSPLRMKPKYRKILYYPNLIHPQDAGFGAWIQRIFYRAQGGKTNLDEICFLGGLHNLLMGYIDNIVDDKPEHMSSFKKLFSPKKLLEIGQGNMAIVDSLVSSLNNSPAEILLTGIMIYLADSYSFAKNDNNVPELWQEFILKYVELYKSEFDSAKLLFNLTEASEKAFETCITKTADVIIPHVYLTLMAKDTNVGDKKTFHHAAKLLGKVMVISEDLCDIIEDLKEKKWNYVTLSYAKKESIRGEQLFHANMNEIMTMLLDSDTISSVIEEMVKTYNTSMQLFDSIGKYGDLSSQLNYVLWYPVLNSPNKLHIE